MLYAVHSNIHLISTTSIAMMGHTLPSLWITIITYLTAFVHVFASDSLPYLFHAVFARFGPSSLYNLIVSYYLFVFARS